MIIGAIAAGLDLQAADDGPARDDAASAEALVEPGVAMPTARGEPTLSSTWYCAGGPRGQGSRAHPGQIIHNPTHTARNAPVPALNRHTPPAPQPLPTHTGQGESPPH